MLFPLCEKKKTHLHFKDPTAKAIGKAIEIVMTAWTNSEL